MQIPLNINEREIYRDDLYHEQYEKYKADEHLEPVELGGGANGLLERRPKDKWNDKNPPTREEMWLCQEDFWVKKDMLEIVHSVLEDTAKMTGNKLPDKDSNLEPSG